jgi:electron transfer flavoprotein alpha subunit
MTETEKKAPASSGRAGTKRELPEHFKAYKHVWVVVESEMGVIHPVSLELLGEGRKLADKRGVQLAGVVLGSDRETNAAVAATIFEHGADRAYVVTDPALGHYRNESYTKAVTDLVNSYKPEILLLGATNLGRDLAGSVATTLLTGLTADCTELAIDEEGSLAATRPTFGGSLLCTILTLNYRPQMATVRPRVFALPAREPGRSGESIEHPLNLAEDDIITKVVQFVADRNSDQAQLAYADIVVAGGLGLRSMENFQLIKNLAAVLGAEYGGSRPLVQKGWIPSERQIGQTGKTIRPKLYIAAGISGAIQHRVGVEGADTILAINTDPNAPIFQFAHLGVIADAIELLPVLTEAFRARLAVNRLAS